MLTVATSIATLATSVCRAQEVALPEASPTAAPKLSPTPTPATAEPTVPPPLLIPPDVLPMPDPSAPPTSDPAVATIEQLDEALKPKSISKAAEDYRLQIEWRKLRNQAANDPDVKAAFAASQHARTDLEKRRLLERYFNVLFDKEIALGPPEMKSYLNERRAEHMRPLPQPRVRPPSPTPTPTPKPGDKASRADSPGSPPPTLSQPPLPSPTPLPLPSPTPSPPVP